MRNSSIVLLSGGLDSLASFYWALKETDIIMAITFDYGQKAFDAEMNHSKKICSQFDIKHKVIQCPWFKEMKGSSLTNRNTSIPQVLEKDIDDQKITKQTAKLVWVPNRNGVFVNIAASIAEDMLAGKLIVGFNQEEAETFLDNSSHYLAFTNEALKYSTKDQVVIEAPMIDKTKTEIVKWLLKEKVDLRLIWSCYHDGSKMCGQCESCSRLKRALRENNQESALESFFAN